MQKKRATKAPKTANFLVGTQPPHQKKGPSLGLGRSSLIVKGGT